MRHRAAVLVKPEGQGVGHVRRAADRPASWRKPELPGGGDGGLGRVGGRADGREDAGVVVLREIPVVARLLARRRRRSRRWCVHVRQASPVAIGNRQRGIVGPHQREPGLGPLSAALTCRTAGSPALTHAFGTVRKKCPDESTML